MEDNNALSLEELQGDYSHEVQIDRISEVKCGVPDLSMPKNVETMRNRVMIFEVMEFAYVTYLLLKQKELQMQILHDTGILRAKKEKEKEREKLKFQVQNKPK
ncbi:uncharacterized protein LOC142526983 [Primulina tabacum]|uniref:uncharacterized protein LOC142526983 n=1 Tax=Primulina tabacum TaxID=48773 RepID=UPI003F5A77E4